MPSRHAFKRPEGAKDLKITVSGKVGKCHSKRLGPKMWIHEQSQFPPVPFLLTSNNNLKYIYGGKVNIEQTKAAREIFEFFGDEDGDYSILSQNMIGIVQKRNKEFYLTLFAESDYDIDKIKQENFFFAEWEEDACIINNWD